MLNTDQTIPIRPLSPDQDFAAWLNLIHAVEMKKTGAPETTAEHLRRVLASGRGRRWVAEAPDDPQSLIGYALLYPQIPERSYVEVLIHPAWRRRGLGSRMLGTLHTEARRAGAQCTYNEINDRDTEAIAFLQHNGYRPAGDAWVLRAPAEADFAEPVLPPGYTIRSYAELPDLQTLTDACNRGFADMMGHHENTAGGIKPDELGAWVKNWNPNGVFMAFAPDGSVIGSCKCESSGTEDLSSNPEDLVDEPGVAPEHRHLRLQRPMVLTALRWLRSQARRPVRLESWGDTPETIELYKEIGFKLVEHAVSLKYDFSSYSISA